MNTEVAPHQLGKDRRVREERKTKQGGQFSCIQQATGICESGCGAGKALGLNFWGFD
jgi:hypothetical protein